MTAAGYSGTPLVRKLGIKPEHVVAIVHEPQELRALLGELPDGVELRAGTAEATDPAEPAEPADVVLVFVTERTVLEEELPAAARAVFPDGMVWVAWPKRASKVPTDVTEDVVREVALPAGLVDTKVCAISDVWSGLRVVWRKENRT